MEGYRYDERLVKPRKRNPLTKLFETEVLIGAHPSHQSTFLFCPSLNFENQRSSAPHNKHHPSPTPTSNKTQNLLHTTNTYLPLQKKSQNNNKKQHWQQQTPSSSAAAAKSPATSPASSPSNPTPSTASSANPSKKPPFRN